MENGHAIEDELPPGTEVMWGAGSQPSANGQPPPTLPPPALTQPTRPPATDARPAEFSNYYMESRPTESNPDAQGPAGHPIQTITQQLFRITGGWPKRVGRMLFVPADDPWLDSSAGLFAWIGSRLPQMRANRLTWNDRGLDMVSRSQFFAGLQQSAEPWDAVEPFPHYPPLPRHYYLHPDAAGGDGAALRSLLARFEPATPIDADLILAFFLSLVWGGKPGQRPAWLVTVDSEGDARKGRGAGKSTLAKMGGRLVGGTLDVSPRDDMSEVVTRLLSPGARGIRLVVIDNIKSLKFSWGELEKLITSDVISGRQLYTGNGQRPNTVTWCLTVNGASLSKDLAERSIPIMVRRPEYTARWEDDTNALIDSRRWEIIGDCLALLRAPGKTRGRHTRWESWEENVLSKVSDPEECQRVIAERQGVMDDDANESSAVREAFIMALEAGGHDSLKEVVWISSKVAAAILNKALDEKYKPNSATTYLGNLAIKELRKCKDNTKRGWVWTGTEADPTAKTVDLILKRWLADV
jgi:hypothetical protein